MAEEKMAEMLQTLTGVLKGLSVKQTPQLPKVKLQKFRGPPRSPGDPSLKEWLDEFEAYSNCYKLSGKSKAQALVDHLGGIAKEEILCRADSVREDYDELVQILKSQFCPVESLQTLSASFHSCVQKDGESLADFSRNLMRYYSRMEQAAPSEDEKKALHALRDTSLKEGFVRGAREALVRRELRRIELAMKSKPFMDMRSEALDLFRDQESIRKIGVKEVKMEDPLIGIVSCDRESVVDTNELSELRGHLNQLCKQVAVLADSVNSMKTTPKVPQNEVVCYNCGKKGHIRPRCTEPTLCYNCKGRGHISKNCPEAVISNSPISSNVPMDSPSVRVSGVGNTKSSVLTQKLISHSPRGKVRFKDVELGCVFDTGAETSIIPSSVFHSQLKDLDGGLQQLDGLFVNVVGVGGVEVPVEGYVEVPINIEGHDLVGSFLVTHDEVCRSAQYEHPILLGCGNDIRSHNLCWIMQLLGVICLQTDYTEEICGLPADQARLTWDVTCFLFVVFQRQIFTSNYFLYIVLDLTEEEKLASKGAELINEILAAKVRNKRLEEERILEGVKRKMKRIKEKQLKLTSKKNQTWQPKSHAEAIRGTGGYYMFEDVDDDDLSDLEAEGITSSGEPSSPKNPLQLAFHGIVEDPKKAIQIDKEHQAAISGAEEDPDDPDADAAVSGEGGDKDRFKDGKSRVDEAQDDDETATRGSYTDDIEMEQEEEPEGTVGKIKSALALTWLIFLRSVDTLIQFLDNISKEYRYVAKELKKLTTEGKRRRAMKKHKPAELQDMSGKESEKEELETKGTEEKQAKDGATGSPADENESPTRDISNGHDETCSTAETSSSDQFRRTMIRPVRLIYAALYAIIAQSQLVCYFIIILNQLLSASLLSLPLVLIVFLWAMLSVPRPTKTFWITVISYTEVIVILKYLFQFQFYPWNSDTSKDLHSTDPLWFPRILGIEQKPNYAVLDLCILLSVFFHRSVLIRHGLWQESRVVPDLDSQQTDDVPALTSTDMAVEDQNGDEMERAGKKDKKKKKKKRKEKEKKPAEEGGAKAEVLLSTDDEQQLEVQDAEHQGSSDLSELEDPPRRWYQPVINFYHNMIDPMYSAVTDVYVFIFGIQFICFLIIALFSSAFGEERATSDVAQLISSNTIPISFLLLLLIMFIIIVIDRAIYLCKNVKAKFIYLVVLVIAIHLWLFFILPSYNNKPFVDNNPAQVWYFFICIYFGLSAYQITSGYPTRILGNFLCKNYNLVSLVLFYGWRVIPFLTELRTLMDWIWTDTTLSLSHWLQVEDIYANVYPIKCFRNREVAYPVPRGTKTPWIIKYGVGGGMLIALIFVLWFPLILISLANTTSIMNPPTSMSVEIGFGGFEPIFKMNAQSEDLNPINTTQWNNLQAEFAQDLNARTFLDGYRQEDVVIATISGNSTGTWDISPPSRENLIKSLQTDVNLYIYFKYSFTRITNNAQVTPTIENNLDVILTKEYDEFRDNMTQQLEFTNVSSVMKNFIPSYIKVPALSSPEPVTILLEKGGYVNASLHLEVGGILDLVGTKEWWEVADSSSEESSTIQILTFNERVASELLAPLSSYGIIGLYVSLVLVIGRFLRMYFSGISYQIMFNELPNVDRILKLCLDIYLVRESDEMELEEDLTAKLIFLYRSPETLIKVTKWKTD